MKKKSWEKVLCKFNLFSKQFKSVFSSRNMAYDFNAIEKKWQKKWEEKKVFVSKESKKDKKSKISSSSVLSQSAERKKFYVLDMFPYPSGEGLHMGHAFVFSLGDIFARFKRLQGFNVLYPIGYDSLGLPAENAAIKKGIHPEEYTKNSIANFMRQQKAMGWSYDWNRMFKTSDPEFYKWDQWIFLQMLKKGLAYRKKSAVNFCSKCQTVLANEQVVNGKCWRHEDTSVEIKQLEQWYFKTTAYADELLLGLDKLEWPERAKTMQRNWIGRSYGTEILFEVNDKQWPIFTTRPDTIFGVTFMVISAHHSRLYEIVTKEQRKEVDNFLKKIGSVSEKELGIIDKEGVFTGSYAINPLTKEKVPIYAGNFVVADYGCGMVMAVPAHDNRDYDFAKKYKLPIKYVIQWESKEKAYTGVGKLINSGDFNGLDSDEAKEHIVKWLEANKLGKKTVNYKLRDWLISRQRYWGTPIPVVYCDKCKKNIEENSLEINFRDQDSFNNLANGSKTVETRALNPEEKNRYFGNVKKGYHLKCVNKIDGRIIYAEILNVNKYTNLHKLFEDKKSIKKIFPYKDITSFSELEDCYSFIPDYVNKINKNGLIAWDVKLITPGIVPLDEKELPIKLPKEVKFGKGNPLLTNEKWVNTKCPKCKGKARRETDTMDTFVNSSWYFLRYTDPKNKTKVFDSKKANYWCPIDQYIGGPEHITMHLIYTRFYTKFFRDLGLVNFDEPALRYFTQGVVKGGDGNRMSKSKGNVVEPLDTIEKYGADSLRLYLMSASAPDSDFDWDEKGIQSSFKFLNKVYDYFDKIKYAKVDARIESKLNKTIKEVTNLIEEFKHNLAIIKIRGFFDYIYGKKIDKKTAESFLNILHVYCPFITEEIWKEIGGKGFLSLSSWPKVDERKINLKFDQEEESVESLVGDITNILKIVKEKGKEVSKAFVYVIPKEKEFLISNLDEIRKRVGIQVEIYAVNEAKHDPEGKAKKARPNRPAIYLE